MNPLYSMLMNQQQPVQQYPAMQMPAFSNPIQKMNYMVQALKDPVHFVLQQFPDIPENIVNDPNQVLQYIQRTRNISNDQISRIVNQFPRW